MADPIIAPCRKDYYPAVHDSGRRPVSAIWWIVLHDEEASTAAGAAQWFRNPKSGGSTHLCVDDQACYRCLANVTVPWGAASSFGANRHGFHIEQAGYARWSAVVWMSHLATLRRAAYKTALHCKAFKVPVQFVTAAELPDKHGITTHAEVTAASRRLDPAGDYTHTDPGLLWPRWLFMRLVRGYYATLGKQTK